MTTQTPLRVDRAHPPRLAAPRPARRSPYRRRRMLVASCALVLVLAGWLASSLGPALLNPALGTSASARLAEWARTHGASSVVNWAENEWYSHHRPPVGGAPPKGPSAAQRRARQRQHGSRAPQPAARHRADRIARDPR